MAEEVEDKQAGGGKREKAPAEIKIEDFADLVSRMSRFMTRLVHIEPFKNAKIGLAEWSVLSAISQQDGISTKQIARSLGVTSQRINQLSDSLKNANLIAVQQAVDDTRKNAIALTEAGREQLAELNAKLLPLIKEAFRNRDRIFVKMKRGMKHLTRMAPAPKGAERKAMRAAKRAGRKKKAEKPAT